MQFNYTEPLIIGTHNAMFHTDELVACALFAILYDGNIKIIRTRNPEKLAECDIVVDIGGGAFDHHMPGGNGTRENGIPYASAGLVFKDFGYTILSKLSCPDDLLEKCFELVDKQIIEDVDKIDNGIDTNSRLDFIKSFNPKWFESFDFIDQKFNEALMCATSIIKNLISEIIANVLADKKINELLKKHSGRILELECQYIPWTYPVIEYNETAETPIDFVVFKYPAGGYAAQAVPPSRTALFSQRVSFPKAWAGLTTELAKLTDVKTATFCHNNLFFARADEKEDIYKLCELAFEE